MPSSKYDLLPVRVLVASQRKKKKKKRSKRWWWCSLCRNALLALAGLTVLVRILIASFSIHIPVRNLSTRIMDLPPFLCNSSNSSNISSNASNAADGTEEAGEKYSTRAIIKQRRLERQQHTRPPPQPERNTTIAELSFSTLGKKTRIGFDDKEHDWTLLCHNANLAKESRVMITGALSTAAGPPLALLLAKQCGVIHITGVDHMLPNSRKVRLKYMHTYKQLYRNIDEYTLVVPTTAVVLGQQLLRKVQPTHIFHVEPAQRQHLDLDEFMSPIDEHTLATSRVLYRLKHSTAALNELLSYCQASSNKSISFLHVTTKDNTESMKVLSNLHQRLVEIHRRNSSPEQLHTLQLPPIFGPMVADIPTTASHHLFVDDAVAAMLRALQHNPGQAHHDMQVSTTRNSTNLTPREALRDAQTEAYREHQEHPYGIGGSQATSGTRSVAGSAYHQAFGMQTTQLPCATQCTGSTSTCTASVWDMVVPASVTATEGCRFVVYISNFDANLERLFQPKRTGNKLCRIAFVSGKSLVARASIQQANPEMPFEQALDEYNGKLKMRSWTLVWLPKDDESTLTDAESALVLMQPDRLFASSVEKAMYTSIREIAELKDRSRLKNSLEIVNLREVTPNGDRKAVKGRTVTLLAHEPTNKPKSIEEYEELTDVPLPWRQIEFYKKLAHWVQSDFLRSKQEIDDTVYAEFPFQWVAMGVLVHDFTQEEARLLRCSWYDEHLHWGSGNGDGGNRGAEELSLAYVIAKLRIQERLGPSLAEDSSWIPVLNGKRGDRVQDGRNDVFMHILPRWQE